MLAGRACLGLSLECLMILAGLGASSDRVIAHAC